MKNHQANIARSFVEWCEANNCLRIDDPSFLPSLELTIANAVRHSLEAVIASAVQEILRQATIHNEPLQIDVLRRNLSKIVSEEVGKFYECTVNDFGNEF